MEGEVECEEDSEEAADQGREVEFAVRGRDKSCYATIPEGILVGPYRVFTTWQEFDKMKKEGNCRWRLNSETAKKMKQKVGDKPKTLTDHARHFWQSG